MKKLFKYVAYSVAVLAFLFVGAVVCVRFIDADHYRPHLSRMLSEKTGRTVAMNGPIRFSFGLGGLHIQIQDVALSNPSWASRPSMFTVGNLDLGVGVLPLLSRKLEVQQLVIKNADIALETSPQGAHNWDFAAPKPQRDSVENAPAAAASPTHQGSLVIDGLRVEDSRLSVRGADGATMNYNVSSLTLMQRSTGAEFKMKGDVGGIPVTLNIKTNLLDFMAHEAFTFDVDATYNTLHLALLGKADITAQMAEISAYEITAGKSKITGDGGAEWAGARPFFHGRLVSDAMNPADFKAAVALEKKEDVSAPASVQSEEPSRVFSDVELPLDVLKMADAQMDVAVGGFPVGKGELTKIVAKMVLTRGQLELSPAKALVGEEPVNLTVKLDAAQNPARYSVALAAENIDLGEVQKLGNMTPFMSGKAAVDIRLSGSGKSAQAIASSMDGVISVTAEKGQIMTNAASAVSSSLAAVFSTVGGDDALNCLAARFIVKGGVLRDNGILIDSAASTVVGGGLVDLRTETVKMTLRAKTKLLDIGNLVPALQIGGSLKKPTYAVDASGMVKNVVEGLSGGVNDSAFVLQNPPNGQNACVYTLDHPKKKASTEVLASDPVGKASQKIQNFVKGLFGK